MLYTRISTLAFFFVALVVTTAVAEPKRITKDFPLSDKWPLLFLRNTTALYASVKSDNVVTTYDVTREKFNFDGSSEKQICSISIPKDKVGDVKLIGLRNEHVLLMWINETRDSERSIVMENVRLLHDGCGSESTVIAAPPRVFLPSLDYVKVFHYANTYDVIINGARKSGELRKAIFDFAGHLMKNVDNIDQFEESIIDGMCEVVFNAEPADSFVLINRWKNASLIRNKEAKVLRTWSSGLDSLETKIHVQYKKDIVVCTSNYFLLYCSIFDGEGHSQHEISIRDDDIWVNKALNIYALSDGLIVLGTRSYKSYPTKKYLKRYDFKGQLIKELLLDDAIINVTQSDLFENDAGELCVSILGTDEHTPYNYYIAQCYNDL